MDNILLMVFEKDDERILVVDTRRDESLTEQTENELTSDGWDLIQRAETNILSGPFKKIKVTK
jgi:hypothetical protein